MMAGKKKSAATMRDVSQVAGVSRYTVSKVLNRDPSVKESTRAKVMEACKRLNYTPDLHAVSLVRGRSTTIGLLVAQITDPFYNEIIAAAEKRAASAGYHLVYACTYDDPGQEESIVRRFLAMKICGLIAAPVVDKANAKLWRELESRIPVVYFDRYLRSGTHYVINDNRQSAFDVTSHLLDIGGVPAYLGSAQDFLNMAIRDRDLGYAEAMQSRGHKPMRLPVPPDLQKRDVEEFGFGVMDAWLAKHDPPSAILCATDAIALGVMAALDRRGIRPGRDVAVAGHDNLPFSAWILPSLTTVEQPKVEIGSTSVKTVIDLVKGSLSQKKKVRRVLRSRLVVRDSSTLFAEQHGGC